MAATPETTISVDQETLKDISCVHVRFHLPQEYGRDSVPVPVPAAWIGTGKIQRRDIYYVLLEEIIAWLTGIGSPNSFVRRYQNNNGQPVPRSSLNWQNLHCGFTEFITSLRRSCNGAPLSGQISTTLGVLEVTSSGEIAEGHTATLILSDGPTMSLFVPHSVFLLPTDWALDWLEVRNELSAKEQSI